MSKRKNSSPNKLSFFHSYKELRFNESNSETLSLNISDTSVLSEKSESLKYKKRKVLKTYPKNCVILGNISLSIKECDKIVISNYDCIDLGILLIENKDTLDLKLQINGIDSEEILVNLECTEINHSLHQVINDLFQHHFIWVIEDIKNLHQGLFNVSITTTPEKTPILKATNIVKYFFGNLNEDVPDKLCSSKKISTQEFFEELKTYKKEFVNASQKNVQHEKLLPKLRPYQARAVQWMIHRENQVLQSQDIHWLPNVVLTFQSKCNKNIYFNKYSRVLSLDLCDFSLLPRGGILADEMGLGKTVAIISLILNNKPIYSSEKEFSDINFLSPFVKNENKSVVLKSSVKFHNDNEIIKKNKEDHLDADEKLICNKVSKGPALKRALTEWYESKLAEYSTTVSKKRKVITEIKCICGNESVKREEKCIQCQECERYQHIKCVGFKENFIYFCPPCWSKQKLIKSSGTLIIAPTSIYHQWLEEINKHVATDGFKNGIFMYNGLKDKFIQPSVLSTYDIVLTTYAILQAEVNHAVQNDSTRKLRNEERYLKLCSPLTRILWWRLCLDEAQMVENAYSQMNQMAHLITSVNRWSVTGTPIQKSISDLFYLFEWLRIEPFSEKTLWNNLLYLPYINGNKAPMYTVVSKIFWRNSKIDVADELIIPSQSIKYHFLKFSAIEQNFYMREHSVSSAKFSEGIRKLHLDVTQTIDLLDKQSLTKLLAPLLNLRQACSHPLAVKGRKISSKTGSMTLTELLKYLFNKTKLECEEAMRKYVAALNGLAGICCIQESWLPAVEYYRQVLLFTEEYKQKIQIDSLQRIHTMTNLAEILQFHSEGIPPTLRDDSLKSDAKLLEDSYMQKAISDLASENNALNELSTKVSELLEKFETGTFIWWNRLIHFLTLEGAIGELMDKIATELSTSEVENRKNVEFFLSKISSVKGIEIMLRDWLSSVEDNRKKALSKVEVLKSTSSEDLVYHAVDCHLRTFIPGTPSKKKKCQLCVCESVLLDYECALFDVSRKKLKEQYDKILDGAQTKGSWRAQNAEKCLRILLNVSKSKSNCETWCLKDGRTHIQLLEAMKKEFKQLRAVWMSINHQVQAYDEISMCKLRLRLRLPGEPIPPKLTNLSLTEHNKVDTIYIIENHEIEPQKIKLSGELELSKSEFKKKYGTLLYLENLGKKENSKPEPCPVCKTVLDNEWCVLQCGHSYCIDCLRIMLSRSSKPSLSCPVCREITKSCDISFIDLTGKQNDSDINVVGDHSTKVEGIIRVLLELKKNDPKVKVLIFSTWAVVLKILELALTENGILFRRMPGHKYQLHLKEFRDPNLNVTALLLPISWGSKGLNLTEASHVFLVEPIMNPAEELQAIGRVHRMGQTKETVVHKFLISGTIEEKIHAAVSEQKDKWGQKKVSLEDIENLFDMKNNIVTSSVS